ncbi:prepilin-type N-terminal cleavage/methylation domain-containing protein [Methylomonas sp. EFPC3]|uniref:type IV pilin protein n=1 Tax=Methylomonas sp. EFPC3 TaxID=3021710 RepID=UPI002416B790|nr:prepilin-type N-terminal cleavage/methylation domain-containing protein [Methylomonas sp. EFPC3]WFP49600.1 prepilin-type N-terminal cleavage/methylation domain-containing protein [Methylomonas sp. EFPC3]
MFNRKLQRSGFTLIEALIATAIVGILTAIAVPAYNGYIDRTRNSLAISEIMAIQTEIERYYTREFRYPDSLAALGAALPSGGIDPWGNAYVYLNIANGDPGVKGDVRKDHALNPINTNYDLYSMGKDGVTKKQISQKDSLDDIIIARDGAFVGLAADF